MSRLREVMRFRARVLAPGFASRARPVAFGLVALGLVVGTLAALRVLPESMLGGFCLATFGLGMVPLLGGALRWREVDIEAREGVVRMDGLWGQRLLARRVRALSTAATPQGVVIAVGTSQNRHPVLLQVEGLQEADALCDALAVGNRGLGTLMWSFGGGWRFGQSMLGATVVLLSLVTVLMRALGQNDNAIAAAVFLGGAALLQVLVMGQNEQTAQIRLRKDGVDLSWARCGWGLVPYHCVDEVVRTAQGIELQLSPPHPRVLVPIQVGGMLSEPELEHLMAQIRSASQRAKGQGRQVRVADDVLDDLRRGEEPTVQWLQRLEAQASALRSGAYRGEGHNVSELWEALEDHDAAPELRVAAARVLVRVQPDEAAARVAVLASEQRDKSAREAFELALEEQDMDELARRLDRCGLWALRASSSD